MLRVRIKARQFCFSPCLCKTLVALTNAHTKIVVCDAIKIAIHWYSYRYTDVHRPSRFTCEGLARETRGTVSRYFV